jgi:hypothetical protein
MCGSTIAAAGPASPTNCISGKEGSHETAFFSNLVKAVRRMLRRCWSPPTASYCLSRCDQNFTLALIDFPVRCWRSSLPCSLQEIPCSLCRELSRESSCLNGFWSSGGGPFDAYSLYFSGYQGISLAETRSLKPRSPASLRRTDDPRWARLLTQASLDPKAVPSR